MRKTFDKLLIFAILLSIVLLIFSCIKYIIYGSVTWDEPFDMVAMDQHLSFAKSVLEGDTKNYQDIPANMEWYGVGLKFIYAIPNLFLRKFFDPNIDDNRLLFYASLRGFALFIYIVSGFVLYYTSNLYQKRKSKILALIFFTFPLLAGESYVNIKDIPFAICFSFYSLMNGMLVLFKYKKLVNVHKKLNSPIISNLIFWKNPNKIHIFSTLMAALLINSKATMVAPILIIETFLAYSLSLKIENFLKIILNLLRKLIFRIIGILSFTFLITPVSWLEPFKYYKEVITAFSNFAGTSSSKIAGVQLISNTDNWSLFEYLWRWSLIKIPIIMIILILFFVFTIVYKIINKKFTNKLNIKGIFLLNPIFTFYALQLMVVPVLAISVNSSSYNALRHWSFTFPPLIIFSAYVVDNYLLNTKHKIFNLISKLIVAIFTILGITDNILLMPYSNLSFNTYGRRFVEEENTDIDYWGYSAGELLKSKSLKGYEIMSSNAPFKSGTAHAPHHIKSKNYIYPYAFASNTLLDYEIIQNQCEEVNNVSRNLLFRKKPLLFSKVGICPMFSGKYWKIWTLNDGNMKIELVNEEDIILLPEKYRALELVRLKEFEVNNQFFLNMAFLNKGDLEIVKFDLNNNKIRYTSSLVSLEKDISKYFESYLLPKSIKYKSRHYFISKWQIGIDIPQINPNPFYKDNLVELFSFEDNYIGLVCKRKNKREYRTILKQSNGQFIYKPLGKSGDFIINKVECITDINNQIKKIYVYDSNGYVTYKWEFNLEGIFIKSEQI